jgi:hypothetical protein
VGMKKKSKHVSKFLIIAVVAVILVVIIAGVYWVISSGGGGDSGDNGNGNGGGTSVNLENVNSMQFSVTVTLSGVTEYYKYTVKDVGTANQKMRVERNSSAGDRYIFIVNGEEQTAWVSHNDKWTEYPDLFQNYYDTYNTAWQGYRNDLQDYWSGVGDWENTSPNGDSLRVHDITIDPSLSDSLFLH